MGFWRNFWHNLKRLGADDFSEREGKRWSVQSWDDVRNYNPLDIVVGKLSLLANDEATFEIESDSALVEPLRGLCDDLEAKRYEICSTMLGEGGCYITLATNAMGEPYHRVLKPCDVSVFSQTDGKMYDVALVIERKKVKGIEYCLVRRHYLDESGALFVYYYTTDRAGQTAFLDEWAHYADEGYKFEGANNIGLAYFKSPQSSRGLETEYGVPLNFGCEELEQQIRTDRKALQDEMRKATMKLFADKSIARGEKTPAGERFGIPEDIYLIQKRAGVDGSLIDEFAPATRFADYKAKLDLSCAEYEDQIGLNRGFLTEAEHTAGATATEIRTANVKTISMTKKVQSAMYDGIVALLTADSVILGIALDLWSVKVDWFSPYEDETAQYQRLLEAASNGYAEAEDVVRWLFPNLSQDEIDEKLSRISASKQGNTELAIENILMGR